VRGAPSIPGDVEVAAARRSLDAAIRGSERPHVDARGASPFALPSVKAGGFAALVFTMRMRGGGKDDGSRPAPG
jgi:hypothetical protein